MSYPFEEFIKNNKIALSQIPKPIQDKMAIFKRIQNELKTMTTQEDQKLIEEKLNLLDDEIFEDLLSAFEGSLNHNEVKAKSKLQPYKPSDTVEVIAGHPKFKGSLFKVVHYYPKGKHKRETESVLLETNGIARERMLMDVQYVKKTTKKANEDILEQYEKSGKKQDKFTKTQLKALGLNLDFSQWEIPVGKFKLYRISLLSLHFRLARV